MKKIGIGVLGAGVGLRTHAPGFAQTSCSELVAIYSPRFEHTAHLSSYAGFDEACQSYKAVCENPRVQLIVVASPNRHHEEQVACALRYGKHVLCEKPLALTLGQAQRLVDLAEAAPSQLALVNHQLRFNPYFRLLRDLIRSKKYGRLFHLRIFQKGTVSATSSITPWSWSYDSGEGGGVRLAMGTHLVDLVRYLVDAEISSVLASSHIVVPQRLHEGRVRTVDTSAEFSATLVLNEGTHIFLSAIAAAHSQFAFELDAFFEHAEVHFDLASKITVYLGAGRERILHREIAGIKDGELTNSPSLFAGSFRYYADAICGAIANQAPELVAQASTFRDSLESIRILEACLSSAVDGRSVAVGPPPTSEAAY